MILDDKDLFLLSQCAISAAYQAGHLISSYNTKRLDIINKNSGSSLASSVLTEADLKSQEIIINTLNPTLDLYDLGLLAEENADNKSRFLKDYFWCIDPLDGTLPFTERLSGYSVSISLIRKDGVAVIGVIYDPLNKNLYHAVKGKGAFKNTKPFNIKKSKTLTLITDRSFSKHDNYNKLIKSLENFAKENNYENLNIINQGGAAMNAMWVLENSPSVYFKFPKKSDGGGSLWDYAASSCIFTEVGAHVSDIFFNSLDLNRKDSTFMNHKGSFYASNKDLAKKIKNNITDKFIYKNSI